MSQTRRHRAPLSALGQQSKTAAHPPPPQVEDEHASIAREADADRLLKELEQIKRDEAPSRGAIDQDPLIQEVPEYIPERRFVLVADRRKEQNATGMPTPPSSGDERATRRKRPSALDTAVETDSDNTRRTASPYAINKPTREHVHGGDLLSPDVPTPTYGEGYRDRRQRMPSPQLPSPRRDSRFNSPSSHSDYFSTERERYDDRKGRPPPPTSPGRSAIRSGEDRASMGPQNAYTDSAAPGHEAVSSKRPNVDGRRNTDASETRPAFPALNIDKTRRNAPVAPSPSPNDFASSAAHFTPGTPLESATLHPTTRSRAPSYTSSRGPSPASVNSRKEYTPPRSPRLASDHSHGNSSPTSAAGSRPSSPSPKASGESGRLPKTELDWSTLAGANAARRGTAVKAPSRLASSIRQDSMPEMGPPTPSAAPGLRSFNSLPYPVESGPDTPIMAMPSEREHQFFPSASPALDVPSTERHGRSSRNPSPTPSNASFASTKSATTRPPFTSHRSTTTTQTPTEERPRTRDGPQSSMLSSQTKKELAALSKKPLPNCQRAERVAGYDDWYTVIGAPNVTFCPDCVEQVFERTLFRPSIRKLPQLNFKEKIGCAFGSSPWMRLAWLLTLQQKITDFTLLKDLADIEETSEPCPCDREAVRSWYGLRDDEGYYVKDFYICFTDVRKIERLLPTLSGFFVRLPPRASEAMHKCAVSVNGNRFSAYLDALIATHEAALASRKGPDPSPFIALVEHKMRLRECARDNMLIGSLWHFIPSIPTFTVCEDCYETVVEPEVKRGSDVAMRFNRTVQPVYGEDIGTSCQLYSPRMRRVFHRAVDDNDLKYLARKSKERREAELRLQERYMELKRKAKRLSRDGIGSEEDERRLNRELERISEEWQDRWE